MRIYIRLKSSLAPLQGAGIFVGHFRRLTWRNFLCLVAFVPAVPVKKKRHKILCRVYERMFKAFVIALLLEIIPMCIRYILEYSLSQNQIADKPLRRLRCLHRSVSLQYATYERACLAFKKMHSRQNDYFF